MYRVNRIILFLILGVVLCMYGSASEIPDQPVTTPDALVAFVDKAALYADEEGINAALEEFSNSSGQFVDGDTYIYAYDMDGNLLAHPYLSEQIGKNRLNVTDLTGLERIRLGRDTAQNGGGFFLYLFTDQYNDFTKTPDNTTELSPKLAYARTLDNNTWIGASFYLSEMKYPDNESVLENLSSFVESAAAYEQEAGKEQALAEFNNPEGKFTTGSRYIFVDDNNGTVLAKPFAPEEIGLNHRDVVREYGVRSVAEAIRIAEEDGSGFLVYVVENPVTKKQESKLAYVRKMDDSSIIGSGMYVSEIAGPANSNITS
ncbi:MAG: cache domain-containing protein [Methanospirillum sp.]|nr:cache domain-containing protein [Methanospirillum sp.]